MNCVKTIKGIVVPGKEIAYNDQLKFVKIFCYLGKRLNASRGNKSSSDSENKNGMHRM